LPTASGTPSLLAASRLLLLDMAPRGRRLND
jgi:hypothetical protein